MLFWDLCSLSPLSSSSYYKITRIRKLINKLAFIIPLFNKLLNGKLNYSYFFKNCIYFYSFYGISFLKGRQHFYFLYDLKLVWGLLAFSE